MFKRINKYLGIDQANTNKPDKTTMFVEHTAPNNGPISILWGCVGGEAELLGSTGNRMLHSTSEQCRPHFAIQPIS